MTGGASPATRIPEMVVTIHLGHGTRSDGSRGADPGAVLRYKGTAVYSEREAIEGVKKYLEAAFAEVGRRHDRPIRPVFADAYAREHGIWPDGRTEPNRFQWPIDVTERLRATGHDVLHHHSLHFDATGRPAVYTDARAQPGDDPTLRIASAAVFGQRFHEINGVPRNVSGRLGENWQDLFTALGEEGAIRFKPGDPPPILSHTTTLVQTVPTTDKKLPPERQLVRPMPSDIASSLIEADNIRAMYALKAADEAARLKAKKENKPEPPSLLEARYRQIAMAIAEGNYELARVLGKAQAVERAGELSPLEQARQVITAELSPEHRALTRPAEPEPGATEPAAPARIIAAEQTQRSQQGSQLA